MINAARSEKVTNPMRHRSAYSASPRVLLIDDDRDYCARLSDFLTVYGCEATAVSDPKEFDTAIGSFRPDLLLLDQRLGTTTGTDVLRRLREWSDVPCIVISGMPDPTDRILNLEVGADDEVDKNIPPRELLARIRAILRRSRLASSPQAPPTVTAPMIGWTLSRQSRELRRHDGSLCRLTTAEFETLLVLHAAARTPVRRETICERVFGRAHRPGDHAVDTVVTKLRRKLEPDAEPLVIKTVRHLGYVFTGLPTVID